MVFWSLAIAVAAITCAVLYYAPARRAVNAATGPAEDPAHSLRALLAELDADRTTGKILPAEADAARAELAREALRLETQHPASSLSAEAPKWLTPALALSAVGLAFLVYIQIGSPDLPAQPLAGRPELLAQSLSLADAITRIEAQLAQTPNDLRGWTVIAPAYLELQRFDEAIIAYRRIVALGGATPDRQTDLAEALIVAASGSAEGEAMDLLHQVVAADPANVRARYYIANEQMRVADYPAAASQWSALIALADGDEPWLGVARQGLALAENDGVAAAPDAAAISGMVEGLARRLAEAGGTVDEWTRLVQSYLVLGDLAAAQQAYDAAVAAYPQAFDRGELDIIAVAGGLQLQDGQE